MAAFAGHGGPAMAMFVLAEGVAAALSVVMISAARAARHSRALAVDPGIQALTRNVLHHMGVVR